MALKRSACVETLECLADFSTSTHQHKRYCSGAAAASLLGRASTSSFNSNDVTICGATASEAYSFLQRLTRGHFHTVQSSLAEANLSDHTWLCFAEFNLYMEAHFHTTPTGAIRGYHSYTRMPKEMLAERYLLTHAQSEAGPSSRPAGLWSASRPIPIQTKIVMFLLEKVFACYHEAAIVKYTVKVPQWLLSWCHKWGLRPSPDGTVSVTAVHAYAPSSSMLPPGQAEQPIRIIYVPCFGQ